jgi:glycerate kinase
MHILVAPNAFKNSLNADEAAAAISAGLQKSGLECSITQFPIADGGDGTGTLLIERLKGETFQSTVHDPLGRTISAKYGWLNDQTAIIEMANASGLRLLTPAEYDPLHANTYGTGELIAECFFKKAKTIILCIGGSATVDGGTGMLKALGVKFIDKNGVELNQLPSSLTQLSDIIMPPSFDKIKETGFIVLCDVENRLLGEKGSAAVFGPQKGASADQVRQLENCLTQLRDITLKSTGKDLSSIIHGGAAGGIAAALQVFLDASLVNGIDYFLNITKFSEELEKADIVITGEGSLDQQTLEGKGPMGVARMAKQYSIPVIGMAGKIDNEYLLKDYFNDLICINEKGSNPEHYIRNAKSNLERAAEMLGGQLKRGTNIS